MNRGKKGHVKSRCLKCAEVFMATSASKRYCDGCRGKVFPGCTREMAEKIVALLANPVRRGVTATLLKEGRRRYDGGSEAWRR